MRSVLGSVFDAAWLRRQFTRDAEAIQDLRHSARLLRSSPGFAAMAVLVLALGSGVTVGIFSVVDTLLVRQLPYTGGERVVMIWQDRADNVLTRDVAPGVCHDWRERLRSFEAVACTEPLSADYTDGAEPVVIPAAAVTAEFFHAIGANVLLGRPFSPDEHLRGSNRAVLISHPFWRQAFGADPGVLGRSVTLGDERYVVVGVLPASFQPRLHQTANQSYSEPALYVPKVFDADERRLRGPRGWNAVGRLMPGVTLAQAQSELDRVSQDLAREYPRTDVGRSPQVQALREHLAGNLTPALGLLVASVFVVLLMASANVANLLLARAGKRTRELAVRSAIGAARSRLIRQLLVESLLLATLGCVMGLVVAWITVRAIAGLGPGSVTSLSAVAIDGRVLLFAMALTLAVAIAVGLAPALMTTRANLVQPLRGIVTEEAARGGRSFRSVIVIAEVALAVLLTTGAALLLRSFGALLSTDPGFDPDRVVALQVMAWSRHPTPERRSAFVQQVLQRMQHDPQLASASATTAMPFIEANIDIPVPVLADRPMPADNEGSTPAFLTFVSPGYFTTMGVSITSGRSFTEADRTGAPPVAMVSEDLARSAFNGHPVGRRATFRYRGQALDAEVVGVFGAMRHDGLDRPARSEIVVPHAQHGFGTVTFVARSAGSTAGAIAALKADIRAVDPAQAIYRSATAEELISLSLVDRRFILALLGGLAALAGVLAVVGIYGVISVTTAQRAREFGVRLALGAGRRDILGLVFQRGATMTGLGVGIGLLGALASGRLMTRYLYGVEPGDPLTLALTGSVLALIGVLACLVPARRAMRTDPLMTMRME